MRHFLTICVFAFMSSGQAQLPSYVPTEDLVAWYPFDDNALDISGNEQHGTESNVSFLSESGDAPFQYAHFNGDASVSIPHSDLWNAEEYTIHARYRYSNNPAATPDGYSRLICKRPGSGWGSGFEHPAWGGVSWSINGNGSSDVLPELPADQWLNWICVFRSDSILIFNDMNLVWSSSSPGSMNFNTLPVTIGMRGNGWHELIGDIDVLGFWSRALDENERLALSSMASTVAGCTDPEACNYMVEAEEEDGSCAYAAYGRDCNGDCVSGTIWYVDSSNDSGLADGSIEVPFASIQQAVDSACSGDTLLISDGTYFENVNIETPGLTLIGQLGFNPSDDSQTSVIVDASEAGSCLVIDAPNTTIVGLTMTHGSSTWGGALYVAGSANNSKLVECAVFENSGLDLVTNHAQGLGLYKCSVTNNTGRNTIVAWNSVLVEQCRIQNNITPDNSFALFLAGQNSTVKNSLIGPNQSRGVLAYKAAIQIEHTTIVGHTTACVSDGSIGDAALYLKNSILNQNDDDFIASQSANRTAEIHVAASIVESPLDYAWESAYSTLTDHGGTLVLPAQLTETYSLQSISPGIGAGVYNVDWGFVEDGSLEIDFLGNARPMPAGSLPDLGCFEHPLGVPEPTYGCTSAVACNYDPSVTEDDGTCVLPSCVDITACNFDPNAVCGGGECIPSGCLEPEACNFNPNAECEGESCDYSCCPGPGCCGVGTVWDSELEECVILVPSDTDFDGCVSMTDLLDLLTVFGTCAETESEPELGEWSCGDPFEYQGYDYETVQIGEQCWFAENSRILPSVSPASEYSLSQPISYVYGYNGNSVEEAKMTSNYSSYGVLYNFQAIQQWDLCPSGWHVPSDEDWMELEYSLGIQQDSLSVVGYRGHLVGASMKSQDLWNGNNQSGLEMLAGGGTVDSGEFVFEGERGWYWTSSEAPAQAAWFRQLETNQSAVYRAHWNQNQQSGHSVRCIQDSE